MQKASKLAAAALAKAKNPTLKNSGTEPKETSKILAGRLVTRLFAVFGLKYGHRWISLFPDSEVQAEAEIMWGRELADISFDAYFKHILMHEVSHGLGPGIIEKDGGTTTVNRELMELYSTIEEAKADVLAVLTTQYLIDHGILSEELEESLYSTNLGGMFRSIRFGIGEAHGGGVAIQLNYYLDKGAVKLDDSGLFYLNKKAIKSAVSDLARELLMIEAEGSYDKAKELIKKYVVLRPSVQSALDKLKDVPIDIRPSYPIEQEIGE